MPDCSMNIFYVLARLLFNWLCVGGRIAPVAAAARLRWPVSTLKMMSKAQGQRSLAAAVKIFLYSFLRYQKHNQFLLILKPLRHIKPIAALSRNVHYPLPSQGNRAMTIKAINVRNQFKGVIKEIIEGPVVSEIDVQTASGIVTSVITTRSIHELELKIGSEVIAFVKSTEVSIAKL